tara:strand:+ start:6524 stop:7180 length:657 start_codon:yes stop_codon:yes gene_type:complete
MACSKGHVLWLHQINKLRASLQSLPDTNPNNIIQHFFTQAMETEFKSESVQFRRTLKQLLSIAVHQPLTMSPRQQAASVLASVVKTNILSQIRLADIRNQAVFQVYCKCGVTLDTYFERFSSPPGNPQQNKAYAKVAHGNAICNAESIRRLTELLVYMQFLKRVYVVKQLMSTDSGATAGTLNWMGFMWHARISSHGMSDLIWELFLDLWHYSEVIAD